MSLPPPPRKKLHRFDEPGHARFLTFSCYRRLPLLAKDRSRSWFTEALAAARIRHDFQLWAWVIMPEHVHLIIRPKDGCRLAGVLNGIKKTVGRKAIGYLRANAPEFLKRLEVPGRSESTFRFWQAGGGWDENITDAKRIHEVLEYIHFNPVKRGLAPRPEDWLWSSARTWLSGLDVPIAIDRNIPPSFEFVK